MGHHPAVYYVQFRSSSGRKVYVVQEKAGAIGKHVGGVTLKSHDCLNLGEWEKMAVQMEILRPL